MAVKKLNTQLKPQSAAQKAAAVPSTGRAMTAAASAATTIASRPAIGGNPIAGTSGGAATLKPPQGATGPTIGAFKTGTASGRAVSGPSKPPQAGPVAVRKPVQQTVAKKSAPPTKPAPKPAMARPTQVARNAPVKATPKPAAAPAKKAATGGGGKRVR
jgi:hypothetical protein